MGWREIDKARRILGLDRKASLVDIRRVYRELALRYHPDSYPPDERDWCHEKMAEITRAYKCIMHYVSQFEVPLERQALRRHGPDRDMHRFEGVWKEEADELGDI
jgi:hypothetical protein